MPAKSRKIAIMGFRAVGKITCSLFKTLDCSFPWKLVTKAVVNGFKIISHTHTIHMKASHL